MKSIRLMHPRLCVGFFCLFLTELVVPPASAQAVPRFDRYDVRNGLIHGIVQSVIQDHDGFIWLGTRGGLNRFDGKTFRHISLVGATGAEDDFSINCLALSRQYLWVGTWGEGLWRIDLETGAHKKYHHEPTNPNSLSGDTIQSLFYEENRLWIGTQKAGLNRLSITTDQITRMPYLGLPSKTQNIPGRRVWCIYKPDKTTLLLGTNHGLVRHDLKTGLSQNLQPEPGVPDLRVTDLVATSTGTYWIATTGGLYAFDLKQETFRHIKTPIGETYHLLLEKEHQLWLGTNKGLTLFNTRNETVQTFNHHRDDTTSISHDVVNSLLLDRSQVLWVATANGVSKLDRKPPKFSHIHKTDQNGLSNDKIGAIAAEPDGTIWLGAWRGGLNHYDPKTGRFVARPLSLEQGHHKIRALLADRSTLLWIGTNDHGLIAFDRETKRFRQPIQHDPARPESLSNNQIRALGLDAIGRLWVGTTHGVNVLNSENQTFRNHLTDRNVRQIGALRINAILRDRNNNMWLGTTKGLIQTNAGFSQHKHFRRKLDTPGEISHNRVECLLEDHSGYLWVGTLGGLNRLDTTVANFVSFTTQDGLPANAVMALLEDDQHNIWVSTRNGLSRYDTTTRRFRNFHIFDGLQGLSFVERSAAKTRSGTLLFGGDNGFNLINPNQIKDNPFAPPVVLTGFSKINQRQQFNQPIERINHIQIEEKDKIISFHFAALDYSRPEGNRYATKLIGLNSSWVYAAQGEANYTNLDAGTYTFRAKAANNDGVWNNQGLTLRLVVVPPFYKTRLAYFLYGLLIITAAVGIPMMRIRTLNLHRIELEKEVARRTKEIRATNRQLGERNAELRTLEETVRTINEEVTLGRLAKALIGQAGKLFSAVDAGLFLIYQPREQTFQIIATWGHQQPNLADFRFSREELISCYPGIHCAEDGLIRLFNSPTLPSKPGLDDIRRPRVLTVMSVPLKTEIDGLLVLENFLDEQAFTDHDLKKLKRFRHHAISAIAKAARVEELRESARVLEKTQAMLVEAAHQAGMAEIAANVSHTLGNTLNSISTSTELIAEMSHAPAISLFHRISDLLAQHRDTIQAFISHDQLGKKVPRALLEMSSSLKDLHEELGTEATTLSNQVAYLKRMLRAQQEYTHSSALTQDIDLHECVEDVLMFQLASLESSHIALVRNFGELPLVRVSRPRLIRVLMIIVTNAVEAMEKTEQPQLTLSTQTEGNWVYLILQDNGIGIPSDKQKRIFAQGYTSKQQGNGLGLHFCANVLKEMGGGIEVESGGENCGVAVTLHLKVGSRIQP